MVLYDILCHIYLIARSSYMSYYVIDWWVTVKIEGIATRINANGRIVIPSVIRKGMGLSLGDSVVMSLEDGILRIEPQNTRLRRVQESLSEIIPANRVLSDELIAERREEVRDEEIRSEEVQREAEDWLG